MCTVHQASQAQAENEEFMPHGKLSMKGCSGAIMEHLWLPGASVGRLACCPSSQNLFFSQNFNFDIIYCRSESEGQAVSRPGGRSFQAITGASTH
jgi:hypothetical protein